MTKIYEKISKITIYLLVFLIPIFFFSKTTETLSFNKQILLIFLTFISLLFWMLKSLAEKKISLNINKFNLSIIVFLVILGLSTFFSAYKYGSFWGAPLNTASSFATFWVLLWYIF